MVRKRNSHTSRAISPAVLGKPQGMVQARVQKVGPAGWHWRLASAPARSTGKMPVPPAG
jgi:hypothetical protein